MKIVLLSLGEGKRKRPTIDILLLTLITIISVAGINPISISTSAFADSCIWPQCYYPYDNNQQYGTDDNCKAPDCLIDLNKGVPIYGPNPTDNTSPKSPGGQQPPGRQDLFNNLDMCRGVEKYLVSACSFYVDSNGVLSPEGKRAKDCISGGMMLSGVGFLVNRPPLEIVQDLKFASKSLTDCDGIVKWSIIENDVIVASAFLQLLQLIT